VVPWRSAGDVAGRIHVKRRGRKIERWRTTLLRAGAGLPAHGCAWRRRSAVAVAGARLPDAAVALACMTRVWPWGQGGPACDGPPTRCNAGCFGPARQGWSGACRRLTLSKCSREYTAHHPAKCGAHSSPNDPSKKRASAPFAVEAEIWVTCRRFVYQCTPIVWYGWAEGAALPEQCAYGAEKCGAQNLLRHPYVRPVLFCPP
jgi:hypothetical protein